MQRRQLLRMLSGAAAVVLVPALPSCTYTEYRHGGYDRYPNYEYYYYPDVNVYFHVYSGYYYYPYGGAWRRSRILPGHIHLSPSRRRRLYVPERRPYERNRDHRRDFGGADRRDGADGPVRRRDPDRRSPERGIDARRDGDGAIRRRSDDDRDRIEGENWRRRPGQWQPE